jgi:hypothetical protein
MRLTGQLKPFIRYVPASEPWVGPARVQLAVCLQDIETCDIPLKSNRNVQRPRENVISNMEGRK